MLFLMALLNLLKLIMLSKSIKLQKKIKISIQKLSADMPQSFFLRINLLARIHLGTLRKAEFKTEQVCT